ncbi:glycoside hydrolase family 2 TIM barrel-domain containing protein [Microlunatus sp. GCM10028923]|uniref:glycoside hydrolase family 2 TIM barrel-domain containing protein n=1 Tax=Microlunatus sp. GCM10028923 TaxID=3273400 RepID=UPI00361BB524
MVIRRSTRAFVVAVFAVVLTAGFLVVPATQEAMAEPGALRITAPQSGQLSGTVDLAVSAPAGTTAVRYFVDDIRVSELTDQYAQQTQREPDWSTATDAGWFEPGDHVLRAEADTPDGVLVATKEVHTERAALPSGTQSLNGGWGVAAADDLPGDALTGDAPKAVQPGYTAGRWRSIVVPDSLGAVVSEWNTSRGMVAVYRRDVTIDSTTDLRTALRFESCYWSCRYFVNGEQVGTSRGGYLPTRVDATAAVRRGTNTVAVIVDHRRDQMGVHGRVHNFYWNWGGLLQEVYLEQTRPVAVTELRAEGAADGTLTIRPATVNTTGTAQQLSAVVTVTDPAGRPVGDRKTITIKVPADGQPDPITLTVDRPQLWDLDHPALYTVALDPAGPAPRHTEQTGFRTVSIAGSDFLLNGEPVRDLQGFNRHADYPGLGRTQPGGLADRELKQLRDKGMRIYRPAHYATTPAELDAADRYGLLVLEEVNVTGATGAELASDEVQQYAASQLTKMINRDRSHPSLIAYSVGNETRTDQEGARDYISTMINKGRQLDPDRLYTQVTMYGSTANGTGTDKTLDLVDFVAQNFYAGRGDPSITSVLTMINGLRRAAGDKPILLSEYGVEAVKDRPGTGKGTEHYQAYVIDEHNRLLEQEPHLMGRMYWTSTEFWCRDDWAGGNPDPVSPFHAKGLISYDRKPKLGWKVLFSPVRIEVSRPQAEPGVAASLPERITVTDVSGRGARGTVRITPPAGYTASVTSREFDLAPGATTTIELTLTGTLPVSGDVEPGLVRAVIDSETEAMPRQLDVIATDAAGHPSSDAFDGTALDAGWTVARPDDSALRVDGGSLRLTGMPGTEEGSRPGAANLLTRTTSPSIDATATAELSAATTADGQQLSLYAYRDDDHYLKIGIAQVDGRRVVRLVHESAGTLQVDDSRPIDGDRIKVRLVRHQGQYTPLYSVDGQRWFGFAVPARSLSGASFGLAASAGAAEGFGGVVSDFAVATSGAITPTSVTAAASPFRSGTPGEVTVGLANGSDHPITVAVALDVPDGWTAESATATVPAFGSATATVAVTAPAAAQVITATARVSAAGEQVRGTASGVLSGVPDGATIPLALDAGCAGGTVLTSYRELSPASTWSEAAGFGWVGTPPQCRDRRAADPLQRDFVAGDAPATLRLAVPAGDHHVRLLVGDPEFEARSYMITGGASTVRTEDVLPGRAVWVDVPVDGGANGRTVDLTFASAPGVYWSFAALLLTP